MTLPTSARLAALLATAATAAPSTAAATAVAVAAAAATAAPAASASASVVPLYAPTGHECTLTTFSVLGIGTGPALTDALGYRFDTTSNQLPVSFGLPAQYATLAEGSSLTAVPGRAITDAYDNWGDLFVGTTESRATQYLDGDPLGCATDQAGHQVAFAKATIGGLKVQRTLFASPTAGAARLVQSVQNPTSATVTTSVFVGDMTAGLRDGTLGSDTGTTIGKTSSGDTVVDGDDRWAVTTDGRGGDPAVAHVWDGPDADVHATLELTGAQSGNESLDTGQQLAADQFGYGWQNVTIPAGATASFMSWELMRGVNVIGGGGPAREPVQAALAATAAADLSASPPATIYAGMTAAQIAAVRNWAKPAVDATVDPVSGASTTRDTSLHASAVDFGSSTLAQCSTGIVHWDFGDGTTATGMGGDHRFAAGAANVTVTVDGDCGGTAVKHLSFWVEAPAAEASGDDGGAAPDGSGSGSGQLTTPSAPSAGYPAAAAATPAAPSASAATPAAPATPATPAAVDPATQLVLNALPKIAATQIAKKGVDATVQSALGGQLRFVLTGTGIKLVKVTTLKPGPATTTNLRFPPSAAKALRAVKTLQLRAKLTLPGGAEIISTRPITVHH